ncbi:tektin-4-like isoform X1 [Pungitius pungitius]|uniref:tektin-4-like isoform X1 n=1 Tax=Pungitius pungitius TaxID=134920 RepID=UPI002E121A48
MSVPPSGPRRPDGPSRVDMEVTRNQSQLFRAECRRTITEMDTACRRMQSDDTKHLDQRVRDIQFLRKNLEWKLEEITEEVDVLLEMSSRLAKALEVCRETLRVTVVCLDERSVLECAAASESFSHTLNQAGSPNLQLQQSSHIHSSPPPSVACRTRRPPSERRHDHVDGELLQEREVCEAAGLLLQGAGERIAEQIRLNRSVLQLLEQDVEDKRRAEDVDNSCASMTSRCTGEGPSSFLPSVVVTPEQWENTSAINLAHAEQQKADSLHLRALAESVLERTATDLDERVRTATTALQRNVSELQAARSQMGEELAQVLSELASQQRTSADLLGAIAENEGELRLARARLAVRRQRPSKERCHDPAQSLLLAEVQQLHAHIHKLREARLQSEDEQRALVRCQRELQENLEVKASSLHIDEVVCARHREPGAIHRF